MLFNLYRMLSIPLPSTGLLVITGIKDNDSRFYIAQASEAVSGESPEIDFSFQENLEPGTNHFASFCQQAVGAILTNPSDGKPANFIYHKDKYGLVSIDNDDVFHQGFSETWDQKDYLVQTKSLLFCLQAMDKPIPRPFSNYLTALDPQLLFLTWLEALGKKNQEYDYLRSVLCFENARQKLQGLSDEDEFPSMTQLLGSEIRFHSLSKDFLSHLSLPITISRQLLNSLLTKFSQIAKSLSENHQMTLQGLLEKTSPCLGAYYQNLRKKFSSPLEAISAIYAADGPSSDCSCLSSLVDTSSLKYPINLEIENSEDNLNAPPEDFFSLLYKTFGNFDSNFFEKFIKKHSERRLKGLLQPEEALKELLNLLNLKLTSFQDAQNIVDFWFKGRREIKNNPGIIEQWDAIFFSLNHPELKWLFDLEKHFPRGWKDPDGQYQNSPSDAKGALRGECSLSEALMKEIFDKSGAFKEDASLAGRSKVAKFPKEKPLFYFKKSPEIPGYEYAATLFMRSLGLEGIPSSELLLFQDPNQGLYSVLLTQAVQGESVDKIWQDDSNFSWLDPYHTHLSILCSMLLNPEDGKGDNYILTPDKRRIIPIDNDHMFLTGIMQEERGIIFKTVYKELQSKTVLYCLHEMDQSIPSPVAQVFIDLDIDEFLETWLKKLVKVNENYQNLPPEDFRVKEGSKGTFYRIAFAQEYIRNLYFKLHHMKQLLSEQKTLTPFELLKSLEPYVGKLYCDVFHQEPTVLKRFMRLTETLYEKDKNGYQISRLNSIQMFKILNIPQTELLDQAFLCKFGPCHILEILPACKAEFLKKKSFYKNVLSGKIELEKIDVRKYSEREEKKILTTFLEQNQEIIAYHNSRFISANSLKALFTSTATGTQLRLLDLRGASNLDSVCVELISQYFPNLEYLNLSQNPLLKLTMFLIEDFKSLKRLVLSDCTNLLCIVIGCSQLNALEINNNKKLTRVFLDVPNLTYLDFSESHIEDKIYFLNHIENLRKVKPTLRSLKEKIFHVERLFNQITAQLNCIEKQRNNNAEIEQHNQAQDFLNKVAQILNLGKMPDIIIRDLSQAEEIFGLLEKLFDKRETLFKKPFEMRKNTKLMIKKLGEMKIKIRELQTKVREMHNQKEMNELSETL